MAFPFHLPLTAAQVGTYFVEQYYKLLRYRPDYVHRFYSEDSTMLRIDGNSREAASALLQIHALVVSLKYSGIEIESAHLYKSWRKGVLVTVFGSVQAEYFRMKRKFSETFFLAPQEKGYFVLNDVFHFIDGESLYHQPVSYSGQINHGLLPKGSNFVQNPASNYLVGAEFPVRDCVSPADIEENDSADNNSFFKLQPQKIPMSESIILFNDSLVTVKPVPAHSSAPAEEDTGEPQKLTYASIVAKRQSASLVPPQPSVNKSVPAVTEWNSVPESHGQQSVTTSIGKENLRPEAAVKVSTRNEGEIKSVYVRNLPSTVTPFEIKEVFKKFGRLKSKLPVAITMLKDAGKSYAFVEFEDITGVYNAIKASTVQIAGQQVFIEKRRPNSHIAYRGGKKKGRGRGASGGRGRGNDFDRASSQQESYGNGKH